MPGILSNQFLIKIPQMKPEILKSEAKKEVTISQVSEAPVQEEALEQEQPKGKVEKKAGKRVGYNYIIVKSYKESQKNDVVKCLYIKSLTNFGFCVIKEGSYGDTKDKEGRDIIDRLKWQEQLHAELHNKVRIPRLLGHFEEGGNYYLVIEHIKGKPFFKACGEKNKELRQGLITGNKLGMQFLDYLIQIAAILETIHKNGIVHRDATANNFMIMPNGKVAVIDMEMSYSIPLQYPLPAFQLGTHGYMSPQQEATETPTTAEDVFALGAIILQAWSQVSASKLTNDSIEILEPKIRFFIPDKILATIVLKCFETDPLLRPTASEVDETLKQYKSDLKQKVNREQNKSVFFSKEEVLDTVQQAIETLASPLLADEKKGWFSDKMDDTSDVDRSRLNKTWYASYNRGVVGIIYMLAQAKRVGLNITISMPFVEKAFDLVRERYINRIETANAGLHFGADGIASVLAVAIQEGVVEPEQDYLEWINLLLEKETVLTGIIDGIAGQGLANIICKSFIKSDKLHERLAKYTQRLADKQENNGSWTHGFRKQKITGRKYKKIKRGFGDGVSGTIYFLLELTKHFPNNNDVLEMATLGLRWLIKKAKWKNDSIEWRSSSGKILNYRWAEGSAGIALVFIKAYEVTGKEVYRKYAIGTLRGIPPFITDTNISQIMGLSGLGETYLEAWRVFKTGEWLQRAGWIVQVIMQLKKQHPQYGSYWLVEHERQPVANFMVGNSGVLHFLLRYCYPDKIGFPLSPETN